MSKLEVSPKIDAQDCTTLSVLQTVETDVKFWPLARSSNWDLISTLIIAFHRSIVCHTVHWIPVSIIHRDKESREAARRRRISMLAENHPERWRFNLLPRRKGWIYQNKHEPLKNSTNRRMLNLLKNSANNILWNVNRNHDKEPVDLPLVRKKSKSSIWWLFERREEKLLKVHIFQPQ